MSTFAPSVDGARTVDEAEYSDPLAVGAVPVPVLYGEAQAAMASGD